MMGWMNGLGGKIHENRWLSLWHRTAGDLRDAATALIAFYGICTAVFILFHFTLDERIALVGLLNNFSPLMLLPAVPLVLVCVLIGRTRLSAVLVPAVVMLLVSYGVLLIPGRASAAQMAPQKHTITLLTYNLHGDRSTDGRMPITELIKQANADVVLMQELNVEVAQALEPLYPYHALHALPDQPVQGQGVLSRYPIVEDSYWQMGLGDQRVVLDVDGTRVTIYNVHPLNPFGSSLLRLHVDTSRRDRTVNAILQRAAADKGALIIGGDFNMTDQTHSYDLLAARYHDTFRQVGIGLGFTFPANLAPLPPLARIDYVFHNDDVQSLAAHVWPTTGGSDHRPLWVELAIR